MSIERIKRIVLIVMLLTFTINHSVVAQILPPPDDDQAPEFPIDGGVSILLVLGASYGVYKLRKKE